MYRSKYFIAWIAIQIVTVGIFSYGYHKLSSLHFSDSTGISYLIIGFFLVFYSINLANTLYISNELPKCYAELKPEHDVSSDLYSVQGNSLLAEHVNNLFSIYRELKDGSVKQEKLLEILENKLSRKESLVQLGSSMMITLGLIGTVAGLIFSLTGLESVMKSISDGNSDIVNGLRQALSGMGSAFYTTLFGAVLGGVVLKLLHQCTINIIDEIVDKIALTSEIMVLPYLTKNVQSELSTFVESINGNLSKTAISIDKYLDVVLQSIAKMNDISDSSKNLIVKTTEIQADASTTLKNIETSFSQVSQLSNTIQSLSDSIGMLENRLTKNQDNSRTVPRSFKSIFSK